MGDFSVSCTPTDEYDIYSLSLSTWWAPRRLHRWLRLKRFALPFVSSCHQRRIAFLESFSAYMAGCQSYELTVRRVCVFWGYLWDLKYIFWSWPRCVIAFWMYGRASIWVPWERKWFGKHAPKYSNWLAFDFRVLGTTYHNFPVDMCVPRTDPISGVDRWLPSALCFHL